MSSVNGIRPPERAIMNNKRILSDIHSRSNPGTLHYIVCDKATMRFFFGTLIGS